MIPHTSHMWHTVERHCTPSRGYAQCLSLSVTTAHFALWITSIKLELLSCLCVTMLNYHGKVHLRNCHAPCADVGGKRLTSSACYCNIQLLNSQLRNGFGSSQECEGVGIVLSDRRCNVLLKSRLGSALQKLAITCQRRPRKLSTLQCSTSSFCGCSARHVAMNRSLHVIVLSSVSNACKNGSNGFHLKQIRCWLRKREHIPNIKKISL